MPRHWDFLTNHAHVLLCIAHDPEIRLRDIGGANSSSTRCIPIPADPAIPCRRRRGTGAARAITRSACVCPILEFPWRFSKF